jgi:DNA-binding transcriptional LysR family regulator
MEISDLHIFRSVVHAGGVTRAAEQLHRVQSNVTTRIRQLEQDLGVDLFIREGKRLHLSPAGTLLIDYAERLLTLAQEARDAVHDARPRGLLRLGAMESTASIRLPAPLSAYHQRYPEVKLELRTGNTRGLATELLAGEIDAALLAEPIPDAPFEKVPIFDEELAIVAAAGHAPIKSARDAEQSTVLAFEQGCPHRKRLEDWFAMHNDMPDRIIEMSSYHAMLGCAVAGMGIALLPRSVLSTFPEMKYLSVHPLPRGLDRIQVSLVWRKGARSPNVSALADILTTETNSENAKVNGKRRGGKSNGQIKRGA